MQVRSHSFTHIVLIRMLMYPFSQSNSNNALPHKEESSYHTSFVLSRKLLTTQQLTARTNITIMQISEHKHTLEVVVSERLKM